MRTSRWHDRTLALVILVALVVAFYGFVASPIVERMSATSDKLTQAELHHARLSQIASRLDTLESRRDELESLIGKASGYLPGASTGEAAAFLQNFLRSTSAEVGFEIKSIQIMPPKLGEITEEVSIRVVMSGTYQALVDALVATESLEAEVFIGALEIRSSRASARSVNWNDASELQIAFEATGYWMRDRAA
ncbi:MAG: type II secretion system protein GspM [Desulfovibrionales bacterium]|nr:type II secretion system protein GspM [Desulfovibrionales bacterium]